MASGKSIELNQIPKRTRQWVHQHNVPDLMGPGGKMLPTPANRAERRAVGRTPYGFIRDAFTVPYVKPGTFGDVA